MEFVFGAGFFLLAWIIYRQQKELNKCRESNSDLTTRVLWLQKENELGRTKYEELSELCEEQISRAERAEQHSRKLKDFINKTRR